jgi:hypothetical protein
MIHHNVYFTLASLSFLMICKMDENDRSGILVVGGDDAVVGQNRKWNVQQLVAGNQHFEFARVQDEADSRLSVHLHHDLSPEPHT